MHESSESEIQYLERWISYLRVCANKPLLCELAITESGPTLHKVALINKQSTNNIFFSLIYIMLIYFYLNKYSSRFSWNCEILSAASRTVKISQKKQETLTQFWKGTEPFSSIAEVDKKKNKIKLNDTWM